MPGWLGAGLPFSQVHGHSSLYDWQHQQFRSSPLVARFTRLDEQAKHTTVELDGGRIIGVDPDHGRHAQRSWRAWEAPLAPVPTNR